MRAPRVACAAFDGGMPGHARCFALGMSNAAPISTLVPHPHLFVRWFVQYNPTFTASALCVLGGVLVLSRALGAEADLALTALLELYQWALIGAAALLSRRLLDHRPATILGLIALVFLVDPTLQLSALATAGQTTASLVWLLLFGAKLHALAGAFRLAPDFSARTLPLVAATLVVALPNARVHGVGAAWLPDALAAMVLAVGVWITARPPRVTSRRALGEVGVVMFPRVLRGAALIGALGFAYQAWNATFALGARALVPALGAVCFVIAWRASSRGARVLWAALGTLLCLGAPMVASCALVLLALRHRMWSAAPLFAWLHAATWAPAALKVAHLIAALAPHGGVQWGGLLLALGFVLLPAGIVLQRRLARALERADALRAAGPDGPSTPAAIGAS